MSAHRQAELARDGGLVRAGRSTPRRKARQKVDHVVRLLTAEAVSLTGTRLAMIAMPWYVLVTTGSAARTGLVAFAEMGPYVLAKALGGPLVDSAGARRVSVRCDVASALVVGAVPLADAIGLLDFGTLLALAAAGGAVAGPGDGAKTALIPDVAVAAGVPIERVTGLRGTVERLATTAGAPLAGGLVAWIGPLPALLVNAASFAVAAALVRGMRLGDVGSLGPTDDGARPSQDGVPTDISPGTRGDDGYVRQLADGLAFLRRDRLLGVVVAMLAVTNLLDAGLSSVLLPLWARDSGHGPAGIGLVAGVSGAAAVGGSVVATVWAHRLPRRATFFGGFLLMGAPRFVVLALGRPLGLVLAVFLVSGFGSGFLNPILGAVTLERIPAGLRGRVTGMTGSLAWTGVALGGLAAGALVTLTGLGPALLACAAAYLLMTTVPSLRPEWRELDHRAPAPG